MSSGTIVHLKDVQQRPRFFATWERHRHTSLHWLVECFAEALGVFFYVYAGIGPTIQYIAGKILDVEGLSSVLQIGVSYSCGIIFAIVICSATSGGHFNPAVTVAFVLFKGFPPIKAIRYIAAQLLGGYIACLLIYVQYHDLIVQTEAALVAANALESTLFTPNGPAGAFALYVLPGANLGNVFVNEFITDVFLALVIWGCLDPTNILVPPPLVPIVIGLAYGVAVWGYATPGLAANTARDLGGRFAALTIWGRQASGGTYAALSALTNIPATLFGVLLYELFLTDYARVLPAAHREFMAVHHNHAHNPNRQESPSNDTGSSSSNEKIRVEHRV